MNLKKFTRKIENFTCLNCGSFVTGTGYTNHCPTCLWSRHVDINPGDRQNPCKGMMVPVTAISTNTTVYIVHRCIICGHVGKNRVAEEDNREIVIDLSTNPSIL